MLIFDYYDFFTVLGGEEKEVFNLGASNRYLYFYIFPLVEKIGIELKMILAINFINHFYDFSNIIK